MFLLVWGPHLVLLLGPKGLLPWNLLCQVFMESKPSSPVYKTCLPGLHVISQAEINLLICKWEERGNTKLKINN